MLIYLYLNPNLFRWSSLFFPIFIIFNNRQSSGQLVQRSKWFSYPDYSAGQKKIWKYRLVAIRTNMPLFIFAGEASNIEIAAANISISSIAGEYSKNRYLLCVARLCSDPCVSFCVSFDRWQNHSLRDVCRNNFNWRFVHEKLVGTILFET